MVKTENCHSSGHTEDKLTVAVRLRPLAPCESCQVAHVLNDKVVTLQDSATAKNDVLRKNRCQQRQFVFDVAFGEYISQREVYERTTQQLIADVLAGFNATVFAYGPTGSGKTHTMVGNDQQPGIMVRALNEIFHVMKERKNQSDFQMTLSYLEIYNENIRDLLNPSSGTLELREDAKRGAIEVTGLTAITTFNTKEVMKLLTKGNKERTMEATAANKTSSRSHAMLQVNVRQFCRVDGGGESVRTGRLYMIDLAGSERAKRTKNRGKRLQEGAHINRSLLALGNCINALTVKGNKYVNYRDSKLTRLLKDALSGNCRTVMIAHISPAACQREETFNTLVYADRAKNITNKVKPNALDVSHHVSQYQGIITELKEEICRLKTKLTDQNCSRSTCSSPALRNKHQEAEVRRMRGQLVDLFREQMELRQQLVEIDNVLLWLAMEFERQMFTISQHETEPTAEGVHLSDSDPSDSTDTDPDHSETESEEPPEVSQAWDDLQYIQDEEIKYQEMRKQVQDDLHQVKCKASEIEEMLPDLASTDEERETIELLLKTHLLEIENVEMRRNQLVKDHELRRRDLMIIRYDKQRNLCDQIIERQQKLIHDMERGIPQSEQTAMPDELKEMYALYCQETNSVSRNSQFINQLSSILRASIQKETPSMLSLRGQLDTPFAGRHSDKSNDRERLPPISSQKEDRLFDHVDHTDSSLAERSHRGRSGTPLSIRSSSTSSSAHSTSTESRLPPINLSKQQQQQQQRYSVDLKHNNNRRLLRPHNNSSQLSSRELRSGLRSNSFDDLSGLREPTILNMSHWKTGRSDSCSSWSDIRESEGSVMTDSFPDLRLPDVVRSGHVMPMTRSHTDNVYSQRNLPSIDKRKMSVKESLI